MRGREDEVGKGGEGKEGRGTREGRRGEYRHFFLYTLSTEGAYFRKIVRRTYEKLLKKSDLRKTG